jgi:poly-beta-1,6-N-acetyl-D-glucosamine synthase
MQDMTLIKGILQAVFTFVFFYPLLMSYLWMMGGIYYFFHWERKGSRDPGIPPELPCYPPVSIIVPCYNEGPNSRETIDWLNRVDYPNFEIIAVNDGSKDNTGEILDALEKEYDRLRVIHFATNQGKGMGLRMGALASPNEYLICIDGDALLDKNAVKWMMFHFLNGPRVGAVTGNPRIRTRSTVLGKIQVGEFSSIIGLIKRTQRIYGRVFCASGVIAGFRKAALRHIGFWSIDMVTEDIDVSWNLQVNRWDMRYEPNALCWILMPETLKGLVKQRLRWAQGGTEVLLKYRNMFLDWRTRRMWLVFIEYTTSVLWAYAMMFTILLGFLGIVLPLPEYLSVSTLVPQWHGIILGLTCLLQFAVALSIDRRYEKGLGKYYYWLIWYPIFFWLITMSVTIWATPKAVFKKKGTRAVWVSPDRGVSR